MRLYRLLLLAFPASVRREYSEANRNHSAWVIPLEERLKNPYRNSLLFLQSAVVAARPVSFLAATANPVRRGPGRLHRPGLAREPHQPDQRAQDRLR